MKILLDACCSRKMQEWLTEQGYDTKSVIAVDPSMTDEEVLLLAQRENRLVITLDRGFNKRDYHGGCDSYHNVLLIYSGASKGQHIRSLAILKHIFINHASLLDGRFCMYNKGRLKIRVDKQYHSAVQ